ncbi:phage integrase [Marinobacter qingdaonensis]|uniref:Tyrosine-type recombinase/integrase n=1 Tax=Marinobacter qingdaonensis TaxID=3108486 RepID=A0ABU5NY87_9GAMM|nr:tyrosine-type recombinase/integrase [Marinobacter sp. ASW11-75]MEA1080771.1 tyrosine-type recombinase/integrase [Marinobacter sp. ASW11-75]
MIRKLPSGRWQVDIQPGGRGQKRVRKSFDSKAEAQRFERWAMSQHDAGSSIPQLKKDKRRFLEVLRTWYLAHGKYLRDGERRYRHLKRIAESFGNPMASKLTANDYLVYRALRIEGGISPKTCNNDLGYLNAVFNELCRTGALSYSNPFAKIRPIKIQEREMGYLDDDQIRIIFAELREKTTNPHALLVARLSLETGARWSEAEGITLSHLKPNLVTYDQTKSGKKRSVPISENLYKTVKKHLEKHGSFGTSTISAFRRAVDRSGIQLPQGQCAHILRHTFASHFVMKGGEILTLQKVLGHSSIVMTMRYAHLAPDHLDQVLQCKPKIQ